MSASAPPVGAASPHLMFLSTTFNRRSGAGRWTYAIVRAAVAAGYRVTVVCGPSHDLPADASFALRVVPSLAKPLHPVNDLLAWRALNRLLAELRPDLLHTHLAKAGILGRLAARRAGLTATVHTVHGPTFDPRAGGRAKRRLFRYLERQAGRHTARFVFVGEELMHQYQNAGVCRPGQGEVIRTGKPAAELNPAPLTAGQRQALRGELTGGHAECLLLYVARLVPGKQVDHAIRALAMLRRRGLDARLCVVGEALVANEQRHRRELERLTATLGLAEQVHFAGFRRDVIALMQASDAVLLPSRFEGLPNVAVESVLAQTPLLSYPVLGVGEVIPARLIVAEASAAGLADKVLWLRGLDAAGRRELNRRLADCRVRVMRDYDRGRALAAQLALYRRLTPPGGARPSARSATAV